MARVIVGILTRVAYVCIGLLLGVFFMANANAATFRGNAEVCSSLGMTAMEVAGMRDAGVPWDAFGPWIKGALDEAVQNPESYVKDQDDVNFIMTWFKRIYDEPGLSGVAAAVLIERDCLTKPVSV